MSNIPRLRPDVIAGRKKESIDKGKVQITKGDRSETVLTQRGRKARIADISDILLTKSRRLLEGY